MAGRRRDVVTDLPPITYTMQAVRVVVEWGRHASDAVRLGTTISPPHLARCWD